MRFSSFKIILVCICLTIVGLAFLRQLPIKLSPSQTLPQINVYFDMQGASPVIVEMEVTSKLEGMFSRMKGIKRINSVSRNGGGRITIELDKHIDPDAARFEAATIIRQIWSQLPPNVSYPSVSLSRSDDGSLHPFLTYTLIASTKPIVIQQFAEETIKPRLAPIKGIYQVDVSGANPLEWQFEYDYKQLEILGITTQDIQLALGNLAKKEPIGIATIQRSSGEKQRIRVTFTTEQRAIDEEILQKTEVKSVNGRTVHLGSIVTIRRVESDPKGYYRINGLNTIYLSITADEQANQLDLGNKVKWTVEKLKSELPSGYDIQLLYDATKYITEEMEKIYFRTGLTVLILLLFVVFMYRDIKYIVLVASSLFINVAVALIFYYSFGLEMQLYSLAGLTISLTLIIDNIIVMSDQIIYRKNKKAFLAILAATLTTIGSLSIIFFLDEKIRLNLKDFAAVIIINLTISLLISLFLVPALIEKLKIGERKKRRRNIFSLKRIFPSYKTKQWLLYFNGIYATLSTFMWRWKVAVSIIIVLAFGLPLFLLPDKIESESRFAVLYNKTLGSSAYKENVKPHIDKALGGTWRLFVQKVYSGSYWEKRDGETTLHVTASLPHGSTLEQMNVLIQRMESYIMQFSQVYQFQTRVMSAYRSSISIHFTKENQKNGFPYQLQSKLISKSIELGGGSWSVYGVGTGFDNSVRENAGSYRAEMYGYNYDDLYLYAEKFRDKLLEYRRIKEVDIKSAFSWYKDDYQEFQFSLKKELLAKEDLHPYQVYVAIKPFFERKIYAGSLLYESNYEHMILRAKQSTEYTLWDLNHVPIRIGQKTFNLGELAVIEVHQAPQDIVKENQQYRLCIQYEYVGAYEQGRRVLKSLVQETQQELPVGYTISETGAYWGWSNEDKKQYWLLALIFIIIYFCSSILFNSFKQPLYVVFVIPISFIGLFLTFYLFKLNFDQGGFAAFVLLAGITVNSNIYIINEYNNILKSRNIQPMRAYLKAWNAKVRPIFLTIISTILGFIPFIVGFKEGFWYPLATGTIGGLMMSFCATFLFLPFFMGVGKKLNKRASKE